MLTIRIVSVFSLLFMLFAKKKSWNFLKVWSIGGFCGPGLWTVNLTNQPVLSYGFGLTGSSTLTRTLQSFCGGLCADWCGWGRGRGGRRGALLLSQSSKLCQSVGKARGGMLSFSELPESISPSPCSPNSILILLLRFHQLLHPSGLNKHPKIIKHRNLTFPSAILKTALGNTCVYDRCLS